MTTPTTLYQSELPELELVNRGKVRDIYALDPRHLLIVTTDRLSAFDVILPQAIPEKGAVLTRLSTYWFVQHSHLVPNHLCEVPVAEVIDDEATRVALGDRVVVVKRLTPLPVEAIARGYLIGSGWKDYQRTGAVCGHRLPAGLQQADRLPEPIYTPSSKAPVGEHDQNIDYAATVDLIGAELAAQVRDLTLEIYRRSAAHALARGIIVADTKFEFGVDEDGQIHLIDEVLTPDSSRFWPADQYRPGISPPSFDKQFVRDYLETLDWDKTAPGPRLPQEVVEKTAAKYQEVEAILTKP